MNVVIPLGGVGSRFQKEGYYSRPKPFIPVLGKPMLLWVLDNLTLGPDDNLVVVFNPAWMNMDRFMQEVVAPRYPTCRFVQLEGPTRGAAETVLIGLRALPESLLGRPVLLADGDTFYTADVVGCFREVAQRASNAVFCFHDTQPKPIYSYLKLDGADRILEVKEKVKISDWANTGCYCFRSGTELSVEIQKLMNSGVTQLSQDQQGEFYTSGVIAAMLSAGAPFQAIKLSVEHFHVLGVPDQVAAFCATWRQQPKLRVVFDLDGTLLGPPEVPGEYSSCQPIHRNVRYCRRLKAQGHHVTITTERNAALGATTLDTLSKHGIEYDQILFDQPAADFYVNDCCVDPILGSLDKQLGVYPSALKVQDASGAVAAAALRVGTAVAPPKPSFGVVTGFLCGVALGMAAGAAGFLHLMRRGRAAP